MSTSPLAVFEAALRAPRGGLALALADGGVEPLPLGRWHGRATPLELDPFLVASLIRQESEFNPKAISSARAYGLTQVLPSTGRQLSRRLGITRFSSSMLFEPEINLKLGTYYLKTLLDQQEGSWEQTLASYNAGKRRADEWATWATFREPSEYIETIPFTETRNYIQIVLRNAHVYRRLYAPSAR